MTEDLKVEVEKMMSKEKLTPESAFTKYILEEIHEKTNVDEFESIHCEIKDKANRVHGEIYGRGLSANKQVLTLYYAIYEPTFKEPESLTDKNFQTAMNRLQGFYEQSIKGAHIDMDESQPEYAELKYIYDNLSTIVTVRLCLLSNFFIKDYKIKNMRIDDKFIKMDVWDIEKICANLNTESDHVSIDIDFNVLGYIDPNITINVIQNDIKVGKFHPELKEEIIDVIKCKNPRCITSIERGLKHICILKDRNTATYRCKYCESEV